MYSVVDVSLLLFLKSLACCLDVASLRVAVRKCVCVFAGAMQGDTTTPNTACIFHRVDLLMKCPNAEEVVHHFEEDCNVMTAEIPMSPKSTDDWVGILLQIHSIPLMVSNAVQLLG
jgi:hypothetical protein